MRNDKGVSNRSANDIKRIKCKGCHENVEDEELHVDVVTETDFSYLGGRINSGDGCQAAVTSRTRLGWVIFKECKD